MAGYYADQNASQASPQKEKGARQVEMLLPVTVRQLHNAKQISGDDSFRIDGRLESKHLCIVGQVMQKQEQITSLTLEVADSTGSIDVRLWVDLNDQNEYNNTKRSEWIENSWVRVVGYLRVFGGVRNLVAFRIHRVEDLNEVTFHAAHAAYVHLFYEKGAAAQHQAQHVAAPAAAGGGGEPLQQRVQELLKVRGGAVHLNDIKAAFPDAAPDEVHTAVKWLTNEGWIFTAGDEDHYTVGQANYT